MPHFSWQRAIEPPSRQERQERQGILARSQMELHHPRTAPYVQRQASTEWYSAHRAQPPMKSKITWRPLALLAAWRQKKGCSPPKRLLG